MGDGPPSVLVVDDEPGVLRMLATALRGSGFLVHEAGGGAEAAALFARHHRAFDAVLMDVRMPPPDGPSTLTLMRAIDPSVPVALMSGNTGPYRADDLVRMGAAVVLPKPFSSVTEVARGLWALARPGSPPPHEVGRPGPTDD